MRVVGTSSGAVSAAAILLLEHGDPSAAEVRTTAGPARSTRALDQCQAGAHHGAPRWPTSGASTASWPSCWTSYPLPRDDAALSHGLKHSHFGLRALDLDAAAVWDSLSLLAVVAKIHAIAATSSRAPRCMPERRQPPIASLRPAIRYAGAWCADGVNGLVGVCAVPHMCAAPDAAPGVAAPRRR